MTAAPDDRELLARFVEIWRDAAARLCDLARSLPEESRHLPTDLEGWDVQDNVAHTAHLETVLAGGPEETIAVDEAPHIKGLVGLYTEQGVLARRSRTMEELAAEIEQAVATRHAELLADPPTDGSAPPTRCFGGMPWDTRTLLSNRPLDIWMHEQDIRRAVGRPDGYDAPAAEHVIGVFARALPLVLAKRAAAAPGTSVRIELTDRDRHFGAEVGEDGRGRPALPDSPTTLIRLSAEDYVVLAGGRRPAESVSASYDGDAVLAQTLLTKLAVTP